MVAAIDSGSWRCETDRVEFGAWSQDERWVRGRGQKHNLEKLRLAGDKDNADRQLHGLGTKPEYMDQGFPPP